MSKNFLIVSKNVHATASVKLTLKLTYNSKGDVINTEVIKVE